MLLLDEMNINGVNEDICTPVHLAALEGEVEVVKYLLLHGAIPEHSP